MCPAMPDEQTVQLLFAQGVNSNTVYDRDMQMTKIPFLFCMFCAMLNTLVAISDHMLCHLSPEQKTFQAYLFLCKNHRNCPADLRRRCADLLNSSRRLERKITMKLGIVGLPNVGKSTLFNSLTKAGAESANYPFCTIDPNVGVVQVPDFRLKSSSPCGESRSPGERSLHLLLTLILFSFFLW